MVCSPSLVPFVRSSTGEGVGISCCVAPGSELETPAGPGANPERCLIRCGPRSPRLLWSYAVRSEASDGCGLVRLEPASAYPRWKRGEEEREKGEERKRRKEGGRPSPWTRSPPRASFSRRLSCSPNRIMEGKPRRAALVFLVAFVAVAAGSPACPRPSVVDTILGRPDSCWDSDSTLPLGVYQIGVVEGDEATLQKASSMVQKNREDYVALLFYASWCPFSKICHPNFQILSNLFPTIRHFAFEESVIRPSILSRYGVHGFPTLFLLNSTMRVQYHGSRTRNSLVAFYNHVTGVGPSPKLVFLDNVMDPPDDTELKEDTQENCPFSWARSPEKLLQQDGYLALASGFLLMRLLYFLLPRLNACFQRAWRRQIRYASVRNLWNYFQACTEQAKREGSRLHPCERHHLQEGAMSARAWASQSLASVTLGEPSSGRAYSTGREKLGQDAAGWL